MHEIKYNLLITRGGYLIRETVPRGNLALAYKVLRYKTIRPYKRNRSAKGVTRVTGQLVLLLKEDVMGLVPQESVKHLAAQGLTRESRVLTE